MWPIDGEEIQELEQWSNSMAKLQSLVDKANWADTGSKDFAEHLCQDLRQRIQRYKAHLAKKLEIAEGKKPRPQAQVDDPADKEIAPLTFEPGQSKPQRIAKKKQQRGDRGGRNIRKKIVSRTLTDGHEWRKYGEKKITNSKHPRSYFKCYCKDCPARRFVQRSVTDPNQFEITYRRKHTCGNNSSGSLSPTHLSQAQNLVVIVSEAREEADNASNSVQLSRHSFVGVGASTGFGHSNQAQQEQQSESLTSLHGAILSALKRSTEHNPEVSKGFSFNEVGCIRTSKSKLVCCHFSSDGKILASAGHEKKTVLWNMDTLQTESTPEDHTLLITDVRFRPNSTQLATSSFDKTVRLWDAAKPNYCSHIFSGHGSPVMSIDFHPKKTDVLCSCDDAGEIRLWNVSQYSCLSQYSCSRVSKGGATQVRFQPGIGHLLAAAYENVVTIFDVETNSETLSLQGHIKMVDYVCWFDNGEFLASVSQDSVKVWSLESGECIHELSTNGNKFHSCVFHPSYLTVLLIGGYQSLELWNMMENRTMSVAAHDGLIAALAQSPATGMVASASHDKSVKLWK